MSNLNALLPKSPTEARKTFKACEPGFLHVDVKYLPQMADGEADQKTVRGTVFPPNARRYLFVAIDRATRWVFVRILPAKTACQDCLPRLPAKTAANARRFLRDLYRSCPTRIARILTDRAIGTPLVRETMARGKRVHRPALRFPGTGHFREP